MEAGEMYEYKSAQLPAQMGIKMLQIKNGSQQRMKTPMTIPRVFAAFRSFANLLSFLLMFQFFIFLGCSKFPDPKSSSLACLEYGPRWIRRVTTPSSACRELICLRPKATIFIIFYHIIH